MDTNQQTINNHKNFKLTWPLIVCVIFYSLTCVLSIVVGSIFIFVAVDALSSGEIAQTFQNYLDSISTIIPLPAKTLVIAAGPLTFIVGIFQGLTAIGLFKK